MVHVDSPGCPLPVAGLIPESARRDMLATVRRWELWEDADGSGTWFVPASVEKTRVMARAAGAAKVWEVVVTSSDEAMRARNEHLGFGRYQIPLQADGTPSPEFADDEILRDLEGEFFDAAWPGWCSVVNQAVLVPGEPDPDEVVRQGRLEFACPACSETHVWLFGDQPRQNDRDFST